MNFDVIMQWRYSASTKGFMLLEVYNYSASSSHWNTAWKLAPYRQPVSQATTILGCTSATNTPTWLRATRKSHIRSSSTSAKCPVVSNCVVNSISKTTNVSREQGAPATAPLAPACGRPWQGHNHVQKGGGPLPFPFLPLSLPPFLHFSLPTPFYPPSAPLIQLEGLDEHCKLIQRVLTECFGALSGSLNTSHIILIFLMQFQHFHAHYLPPSNSFTS